MSDKTNARGLFRRAFDNIIEARSRQAQMQVAQYLERYERAVKRGRD